MRNTKMQKEQFLAKLVEDKKLKDLKKDLNIMNKVKNERNKLDDPSGYTICEWSKSKNGIKGRIKSPIIWGHAKEKTAYFLWSI